VSVVSRRGGQWIKRRGRIDRARIGRRVYASQKIKEMLKHKSKLIYFVKRGFWRIKVRITNWQLGKRERNRVKRMILGKRGGGASMRLKKKIAMGFGIGV